MGTVVGGFRIRETIGAGAMGTVYLAEATSTAELVALKILTPGLSGDERFRARFERECAAAACLHHPNVVRTLSYGESDDGALYLAMEYVEGADLREILRREGSLQPSRALMLVGQTADALDAAHAAGIVHRDVKPGNILVSERDGEERALVCDFGLARHVTSVSSLTTDRGFVGTIDYVPPEQITGDPIDKRADVYSLGCVLFECLTGTKPFERESELTVVFAHLNDPAPRVSERRPELPVELDAVFATALAKSPGDRYRSCGELVAAARAAAAGKSRRRRPGRRWAVAAALVALVAAAVGAGLALGGAHGGSRPQITESSIAGARLGHPPAYYKQLLGRSEASTTPGVNFPRLEFTGRDVVVYFPARGKPAHIIGTWNPAYRTAAGIGPCSTLVDARNAYGPRWQPSPDGASFANVHSAYVVGNNLIFETTDGTTISAIGLYQGDPANTGRDSPQAFANYVTANEPSCGSG